MSQFSFLNHLFLGVCVLQTMHHPYCLAVSLPESRPHKMDIFRLHCDVFAEAQKRVDGYSSLDREFRDSLSYILNFHVFWGFTRQIMIDLAFHILV